MGRVLVGVLAALLILALIGAALMTQRMHTRAELEAQQAMLAHKRAEVSAQVASRRDDGPHEGFTDDLATLRDENARLRDEVADLRAALAQISDTMDALTSDGH